MLSLDTSLEFWCNSVYTVLDYGEIINKGDYKMSEERGKAKESVLKTTKDKDIKLVARKA